MPSKVSVKDEVWEDHDNEGVQIDSVTIKLLADGVDTDKTLICRITLADRRVHRFK